MCGVAGVFFARSETCEHLVTSMVELQQHRGPDSQHIDVSSWFALGHNRLAINALGPAGEQPLVSTDGRWMVIFNGEIYNHQELRREHGWADLGPSDGSVIPELLRVHGAAGLGKLRGMFAVCAVDLSTKLVLLAVDPLGIKPLHWVKSGGSLRVASEVRPLVRTTPKLTIDSRAVATYLFRGALDNSQSGFEEIHRVQPGTWLLMDELGIHDSGSTFDTGELNQDVHSWGDVTRSFIASAGAHLMSDVPVSLLMSDGVDSGALAVGLAQSGIDVTAITVDLGGGRRSEVSGAAKLCRDLGIPHEVVQQAPSAGSVEDFLNAMQRPTIDGLNTFVVCQAVADAGFKVALSGTGGDELLTAYTSDRRLLLSKALSTMPPAIAARMVAATQPRLSAHDITERLASQPGGRFPRDPRDVISLQRQIWPLDQVVQLVSVPPREWTLNRFMEDISRSSRANEASQAQVGLYLTSQLLPDADAFSMAHSVELRVPFVDVVFANTVLSLHPRRLEKRSFVDQLGNQYLRDALRRPKQGFSLPMAEWMQQGILRDHVMAIHDESAPVWTLVNAKVLSGVLRDGRFDPTDWARVWSLVALNEWLVRLVAR